MSDGIDALCYTMRALQPPRVDAAGVLLRDGQGRVMLLSAPYKSHVDLPGGMVDPGETPPAAAVREVHEELGLTLREPLRLLVADYLTGTQRRPHGYRFVFDGGMVGRGHPLQLQAAEVDEVFWCDRWDVTRLLCFHAPMLQRRILAAMWAVKNAQFGTSQPQTVHMTNGWLAGNGLLASLNGPPSQPPVTTS